MYEFSLENELSCRKTKKFALNISKQESLSHMRFGSEPGKQEKCGKKDYKGSHWFYFQEIQKIHYIRIGDLPALHGGCCLVNPHTCRFVSLLQERGSRREGDLMSLQPKERERVELRRSILALVVAVPLCNVRGNHNSMRFYKLEEKRRYHCITNCGINVGLQNHLMCN